MPKLIADRIRAALDYRKKYVEDTDAYRVVFSEADFLPGLIIDRYNDVLTLQILTQAMDTEPVRGAVIETWWKSSSRKGSLSASMPGFATSSSSRCATPACSGAEEVRPSSP